MDIRWIPTEGDLIAPLTDRPFYVGRQRADLKAGTLLTVVYSENPSHGTNSHNVDVYHADFGVKPVVISKGHWQIISTPNRKEQP